MLVHHGIYRTFQNALEFTIRVLLQHLSDDADQDHRHSLDSCAWKANRRRSVVTRHDVRLVVRLVVKCGALENELFCEVPVFSLAGGARVFGKPLGDEEITIDRRSGRRQPFALTRKARRPQRVLAFGFGAEDELERFSRHLQVMLVPPEMVIQERIDPNAAPLEPGFLPVAEIGAVAIRVAHETAVLRIDDVFVHEGQKILEQIVAILFAKLLERQRTGASLRGLSGRHRGQHGGTT